MEKAQKYIYETTVKKQVEEKLIEKREENGQSVEVSKLIKTVKPVKIAILRPDRRKSKEAEIFYAKRLSAYLKEGLLPHSLVTKRFLNDGGPLSEQEKQLAETLRQNYVALQEEYFEYKPPFNEEQTKRRGEIILELQEMQKALRDLQSNYSEIFSNTAEAKAKGDVTEWWILNLAYADLDEKGYAPLFGEGDFDARLKALDAIDAKEDKFLNEVVKKLSYFISFWYAADTAVNDEDFASAERNYDVNVSTYVVVDEKPVETPAAPAAEVKAS